MIADFEAPRFIAFAEMQAESNEKIDPVMDDSPFLQTKRTSVFCTDGELYIVIEKTQLHSRDPVRIDDREC